MRENPWRTKSSRVAYENAWIRVREDHVIRPDGGPGIYGVVEIRPSAGIVALNERDEVALVGVDVVADRLAGLEAGAEDGVADHACRAGDRAADVLVPAFLAVLGREGEEAAVFGADVDRGGRPRHLRHRG